MPSKEPSEENILRNALGPGADCLRMEQLEMFAAALSTPPPALAKHVASCTYCQTEIHLVREFQAATPRAGEADAVQSITARLKARSGEIFPARQVQPEISESWWKAFWR